MPVLHFGRTVPKKLKLMLEQNHMCQHESAMHLGSGKWLISICGRVNCAEHGPVAMAVS